MSAWARAAAASLVLAAASGPALAAAGPPASPDSTKAARTIDAAAASETEAAEGLPIRSIRVVTRDIFDPLPSGSLRWFYALGNDLHFKTRPSTVRQLMLLSPGESWHAARGAETMRRLRELDFLMPESLVATRARDSVDVNLQTVDAWTTSLEFNMQSASGARSGTVAFTERNLLGLGKGVALSYHDEPGGITRMLDWNDPALFGSRSRFDASFATGTAGSASQIDFGVPFYAQSTPFSYVANWRTVGEVQRLYAYGGEVADLDTRQEQTDVSWGRGVEENGTVERWLGSFHVSDRHLGPSRLLAPAPVGLAGGSEDLQLRRLALEGEWWRPHFIERVRVNRMSGIEDFDLGPRLKLKVGYAPRFLGSSATEGYLRAAVDLGLAAGGGFGVVRSSLETRYRRTPRETVERIDARWFQPLPAEQLFALAVLGVAGRDVARDFQLVAGGLSGLRAYPVHALAGQKLWRVNAEDRFPGREYWGLVRVGGAAFYDAARMMGSGAEGTGWYQNAGIGLRLAFSRSSPADVVRFDVAIPIDPAPGGRHRPVYSFGSSQAF